MTDTLLYGTHLLAFLSGVITWWAITRYETRRYFGAPSERTPAVDKPRHHARRAPTAGAVILTLLLGGATLMGFGFQQASYQDGKERRDRCVEAWGQELTKVTEARVNATTKLSKAEQVRDEAAQARDDAVDKIIMVIIGLRTDPPRTDTPNLDRALTRFTIAKRDLDAARKDVRATRPDVRAVRVQNPYPALDCR